MSWKNKILLLFIACLLFIPFSFSLTPNESFDCVEICHLETSKPLPVCQEICGVKPSISVERQMCIDLCVHDEEQPLLFCQNKCLNPVPEKRIENTHIVKPASGFWEVEPAPGFWEMIGFFAALILAFSAWYFHKKNRRKTIMLLEMVDSTYERYRSQQDLCLVELNKLKKTLKEEFKNGNVDESNFDFIIGKIDKYLKELK